MTKQMHRSRVTFTLVDAVQTKKVKRLEDVWLSWAHTIAYSTEPFIAESKAERDNAAVYPLISGAVMRTFEEGGVSQGWMLSNGDEAYSRRDSNIDRIESLILDFDNDPKKVSTPVTLDQIKARLDGLEFVYWTSYSHRSDKYGDTSLDMFRVVLPLLNPVSVDEYKERTDALVELFPEADLALKRPSQPYYLPVVHPALREHYQAGWNDTGDWFDFLTLPINVREQREHVPTVATDEIVKSAEEITIRLANGRSLSAADLYDNMREGELSLIHI